MFKTLLFIVVSAVVILTGLWVITTMPYAYHGEQLPFEIHYDDRVRLENQGVPATIHIPSLYVYADIEQFDLDQTAHIPYPRNEMDLTWYSKSTRIGEKGVTVIAGNFDTTEGRPNNFYHLAALEKGDSIEVDDMNGKKFSYTVIDKSDFDWERSNVESLLLKSFSPRLDLIIYPTLAEKNHDMKGSKTIIYAEMK